MRKGTLSELLDKIIKTETKQVQADTVGQFQSDSLVRQNYHLNMENLPIVKSFDRYFFAIPHRISIMDYVRVYQ